LLIKISKNP